MKGSCATDIERAFVSHSGVDAMLPTAAPFDHPMASIWVWTELLQWTGCVARDDMMAAAYCCQNGHEISCFEECSFSSYVGSTHNSSTNAVAIK